MYLSNMWVCAGMYVCKKGLGLGFGRMEMDDEVRWNGMTSFDNKVGNDINF